MDSWAGSWSTLGNTDLLLFLEVLSCSFALWTGSTEAQPGVSGVCAVRGTCQCQHSLQGVGRGEIPTSACSGSVPTESDGNFSAVWLCWGRGTSAPHSGWCQWLCSGFLASKPSHLGWKESWLPPLLSHQVSCSLRVSLQFCHLFYEMMHSWGHTGHVPMQMGLT